MNRRQRALVTGTLQIVGVILLACWLGGLLIVIFAGVANPVFVLAASLGWGFVGIAAIYMTAGGWPTLVVVAAILTGLYVRAGRVADSN